MDKHRESGACTCGWPFASYDSISVATKEGADDPHKCRNSTPVTSQLHHRHTIMPKYISTCNNDLLTCEDALKESKQFITSSRMAKPKKNGTGAPSTGPADSATTVEAAQKTKAAVHFLAFTREPSTSMTSTGSAAGAKTKKPKGGKKQNTAEADSSTTLEPVTHMPPYLPTTTVFSGSTKWTGRPALDLLHGPDFPTTPNVPAALTTVSKILDELKKRLVARVSYCSSDGSTCSFLTNAGIDHGRSHFRLPPREIRSRRAQYACFPRSSLQMHRGHLDREEFPAQETQNHS